MPTLYIVIGLPGSGKSYFLNNLIKKGIVDSTCVYDDYHANAIQNSPSPKDSRHYNKLIDNLNGRKNCAVADIAFCSEPRLNEFIKTINEIMKNVDINRVYFDNNPYSCKENIVFDSDRSIEDRLKKVDELSVTYNIPFEMSTIKVKVWHNVKKPWKEHAFSMTTLYSILTAMVGILLAVIITDKEMINCWYCPISLLSLSFIFFVWGIEKLSDALDEDDVDKYLAWFLSYNAGVIAMFFGIADYIYLHYHLCFSVYCADGKFCINGFWSLIPFIVALIASKKWIKDSFNLIFDNNNKYDTYRDELLGITSPDEDRDCLMVFHGKVRKLLHRRK
jgi:hypothetical protein